MMTTRELAIAFVPYFIGFFPKRLNVMRVCGEAAQDLSSSSRNSSDSFKRKYECLFCLSMNRSCCGLKLGSFHQA
jgi:hypothetical protein